MRSCHEIKNEASFALCPLAILALRAPPQGPDMRGERERAATLYVGLCRSWQSSEGRRLFLSTWYFGFSFLAVSCSWRKLAPFRLLRAGDYGGAGFFSGTFCTISLVLPAPLIGDMAVLRGGSPIWRDGVFSRGFWRRFIRDPGWAK